ncbi:MAG: 3-isopropylmalate dehydratase small subunit, partial [Pyrobaculum sp.]
VGLPVLQVPGVRQKVTEGEEIEVDIEAGTVTKVATGEVIVGKPLRGLPLEILKAGGLLNYLKKA